MNKGKVKYTNYYNNIISMLKKYANELTIGFRSGEPTSGLENLEGGEVDFGDVLKKDRYNLSTKVRVSI